MDSKDPNSYPQSKGQGVPMGEAAPLYYTTVPPVEPVLLDPAETETIIRIVRTAHPLTEAEIAQLTAGVDALQDGD